MSTFANPLNAAAKALQVAQQALAAANEAKEAAANVFPYVLISGGSLLDEIVKHGGALQFSTVSARHLRRPWLRGFFNLSRACGRRLRRVSLAVSRFEQRHLRPALVPHHPGRRLDGSLEAGQHNGCLIRVALKRGCAA